MSAVRIPPEIDDALWSVAESSDPRAIEEFGNRYPAYKAALVERVRLVRRLRSSRPAGEVPPMRFRPIPARTSKRWPVFAVGGLMFATLAWGTVAKLSAPAHGPSVESTAAATGLPSNGPTKDGRSTPLSLAPGDKKVEQAPDLADREPVQPPMAEDPFERTVTLDHEKVRLTSLLKEIAGQAKLKLEVAPGLEDVEVEARYASMPAKDVLRDLGDNFGFTVMVQEGAHALVIPALDERSRQNGGSVPSGQGSGPTIKLMPHDGKGR
ncbi:MAG: hypothetical protein JST30_08880 [Armatimonadetes bacterium]|nr:hypothetical protein [Armatimonadota bacterium]